jgi:hypothetical protein
MSPQRSHDFKTIEISTNLLLRMLDKDSDHETNSTDQKYIDRHDIVANKTTQSILRASDSPFLHTVTYASHGMHWFPLQSNR